MCQRAQKPKTNGLNLARDFPPDTLVFDTRVYHPDKPAPTLNSHMNALFLVGDNNDVTYLDLESSVSMKSFSAAEASFTRGLTVDRAFRVVANAIPRSLLRTVYERALSIRTYLHGHGNWSLAGYPDDASWDHDHIGPHHVNVAVSH